jgi:uncharacterized protein (UPF0147 family)
MSPDWSSGPDPVPYADLENPQTLNLYAYTQNNPMNRTDIFGHAPKDPCDGIPNCVSVTAGPAPYIPLGLMIIGGDGHHFADQKLYENASGLAKQFFSAWKTGPLNQNNLGLHKGRSAEHRAATEQIKKIIQEVEEESGKPISQWGKAEIESAVDKIRTEAGNAGSAIKTLLDDIEQNNPAARNVRQAIGWISEKVNQIQSNPTVRQVEGNARQIDEAVTEFEMESGIPVRAIE